MTISSETALSQTSTREFLGRHETGVLSLARGDEPYSIPISYGYDAQENRLFFRLVSTPDSEKKEFLAATPAARLVVYEENGDEYQSVVVTGSLEEIPREELTVDHVEQYGASKRPLFEIWGEAKADLDVGLYLLEPDDISGQRVEIDR
jgi:nitroimidazol reductase NimA-like FMN-containing flavoprotein (pyridoxamine 5'-phosphate oxidase superfamily)